MCVCAVCELLHAQIWGLINDIKCTDGKTPHLKETCIKDEPIWIFSCDRSWAKFPWIEHECDSLLTICVKREIDGWQFSSFFFDFEWKTCQLLHDFTLNCWNYMNQAWTRIQDIELKWIMFLWNALATLFTSLWQFFKKQVLLFCVSVEDSYICTNQNKPKFGKSEKKQ